MIIANEQYLSELDMIGDADFGVNVSKGFGAVLERLSQIRDADIGTILSTAGNVFMFDVGATIGGFLGRSFQKAGKNMQGRKALTGEGIVGIFETMLETVKQAGGAKIGDKTLVDALEPAVNAGSSEVAMGVKNICEVLDKMVRAADEGAKSTANMIARLGRSSYVGERSRGKVDPGAALIALILRSMRDSLRGDLVPP